MTDDDDEYDEGGGSNGLLGFMFGNVDGSGDLDIDYLDQVNFVIYLNQNVKICYFVHRCTLLTYVVRETVNLTHRHAYIHVCIKCSIYTLFWIAS